MVISNVFNGCIVQRLFDEVVELTDVVGVGVNGSGGEIANFDVFGESFGEIAGTIGIRRHVGSGEVDKPPLKREVRSVKRHA